MNQIPIARRHQLLFVGGVGQALLFEWGVSIAGRSDRMIGVGDGAAGAGIADGGSGQTKGDVTGIVDVEGGAFAGFVEAFVIAGLGDLAEMSIAHRALVVTATARGTAGGGGQVIARLGAGFGPADTAGTIGLIVGAGGIGVVAVFGRGARSVVGELLAVAVIGLSVFGLDLGLGLGYIVAEFDHFAVVPAAFVGAGAAGAGACASAFAGASTGAFTSTRAGSRTGAGGTAFGAAAGARSGAAAGGILREGGTSLVRLILLEFALHGGEFLELLFLGEARIFDIAGDVAHGPGEVPGRGRGGGGIERAGDGAEMMGDGLLGRGDDDEGEGGQPQHEDDDARGDGGTAQGRERIEPEFAAGLEQIEISDRAAPEHREERRAAFAGLRISGIGERGKGQDFLMGADVMVEDCGGGKEVVGAAIGGEGENREDDEFNGEDADEGIAEGILAVIGEDVAEALPGQGGDDIEPQSEQDGREHREGDADRGAAGGDARETAARAADLIDGVDHFTIRWVAAPAR